MCQLGERLDLVAQVIKLEHDGVRLSAVATGMDENVVEQLLLGPGSSSTKSLAGHRLEAALAPPLSFVEVLVVNELLASAAPSHEQMFVSASDESPLM